MHNTNEVPQQARRIEELVAKLEASGDPALVSAARELVEALMDLHGAALDRMLEIVAASGEAGRGITDGFVSDELVGSLLVLYDLHPLDLDQRIRLTLDKLRPRLHGHTIELAGVNGGVVRLKMTAAASGCGSAPGSLKSTIEEAIYAAAPDIAGLFIEGFPEPGFVPLETLVGK